MASDAENIREAMKNFVNETYSIQITPSFIFKSTWKEVPLFGRPSHEVCMKFMFLYKKLTILFREIHHLYNLSVFFLRNFQL
jgi:hypothetical protein